MYSSVGSIQPSVAYIYIKWPWNEKNGRSREKWIKANQDARACQLQSIDRDRSPIETNEKNKKIRRWGINLALTPLCTCMDLRKQTFNIRPSEIPPQNVEYIMDT